MDYKVNHEPLCFWDALFLVLLGIRTAGLATFSWWWVFSPMFIKLGGDIILLSIFYWLMGEDEE